ncbi:4'-phosphopantetheinyl transferase family protein [Catellatospora chokoriensis]|uniref:4'-phosphopantetheinyl transferase family protein n=1 Tax=Catellatospora chokoriensis TaxID=310353 RepID=UPI001EF34762|nr:4'-phosphopantetheinyl transferase superfamily protein [Catellatospora chokoriensis]
MSEAFEDLPDVALLTGEAEALARAVKKRRREYATVRHCARRALAELGLPPAAILSGANREPIWPEGVLGSLTHCDGYRAAALAHVGTIASLGIDAEPHEPLPPGVLDTIARPEEYPLLDRCASEQPGIHWDRLLFSAKESVYKAWFPLARRWLGFEDATVHFDSRGGTFAVEIHESGPVCGERPLSEMNGRWLVRDGLIRTAITVPAA